ncbi:MAG: hypothetical protein REJ23_04095 [Brevundimonas sp.]|nr:hypothetical protein [Brevundimonas sp.]
MKFLLLTATALMVVTTPAAAENWNPFSRSTARVYLADVDSISTSGAITTIRLASTPTGTPAGDLSHTQETYEFDCAGRKWRTAGSTEYNAAGAEDGAYPEEDGAWEPLRPSTLPDFLKQIACDGSRSTGATYPSIRAFIEAGRP